jgi:hypothetical protein
LVNQGLKVEQINISVQPDAQRRHEATDGFGRRGQNPRRFPRPEAEKNSAATADDLPKTDSRFSVMA